MAMLSPSQAPVIWAEKCGLGCLGPKMRLILCFWWGLTRGRVSWAPHCISLGTGPQLWDIPVPTKVPLCPRWQAENRARHV